MMTLIEKVNESSKAEVVSFLKAHEEYSLFLLSNLEIYGLHLTDELYSGNFKLVRNEHEIIAALSLTKGGTLLIHSKEANTSLFELILRACQEEVITLKGVLGEWGFCHRFWEFLKKKKVIENEVYASKEILYCADLTKLKTEQQQNVRLLTPGDLEQWLPLRADYTKEMGFPDQGSREDTCSEFQMKVKARVAWGLFANKKLISIADLNARALDLGQVGGVYTLPEYRKQGFSTTVMRQLMYDAKQLHHIRKLIIFTGETNTSARRVYESLGVSPFGHYALLFG
jgi:predicted GNAT family acetyltransferase